MDHDRYRKELKKALYDRHICSRTKDLIPVFNILRTGIDSGLKMFVPEHGSGDEVSPPGPSADSLRRISGKKSGRSYIPVFTSEDEAGGFTDYVTKEYKLEDIIDICDSCGDECSGIVIDPGSESLVLGRERLAKLKEYKARSHVVFVHCSHVMDMHVSAMVNPTNNSLMGGGKIDSTILDAAGPDILEACKALKGCRTGHSKVTPAYDITHADYIIHTVGPVFCGVTEDEPMLRSSYRTCLDAAYAYGCMSIAFPCISVGLYGYPVREAAIIALDVISKWFRDHPGAVMNVYLCCSDDEQYDTYSDIVKERYSKLKRDVPGSVF